MVTRIIGTPDQIKYLENFNIRLAKNSSKDSVEIFPLCSIYSDREFVIVGVVSLTDEDIERIGSGNAGSIVINRRVLVLKKSELIGFNQTPYSRKVQQIVCPPFFSLEL